MDGQTWMIVERLENWLADKASGFSRFGIPERVRKRAERISQGDLIIAYVSSQISCFADIRRITSGELEKLGFVADYDDVFPYCIRTESMLVLERDQWVPIRDMLDVLAFTRGKSDWRQIMRNPFRLLTTEDAELISRTMKQASRDG